MTILTPDVSTDRDKADTTARVLVKVFFFEDFKMLYILNLWMKVGHTHCDVRYQSEVLGPVVQS